MSMDRIVREHARLVMLKQLAGEADYASNEALLQALLETFAISRTREWVRNELRRLEELGAVTITEAGTVMIATLTPHGRDHVEGRVVIEGVKRPSPQG